MADLDLVVFDLAGTTAQDAGQVADAFTSALAEHGIEVTPRQVQAVRGASKRQALLEFIPPGPEQASRAAAIYAAFTARLAQRVAVEGVRPVPGAAATFRDLRARGVRVALNTGFDRATTNLLLTALGWTDDLVDAVVCGDDVAEGRPAPYLILRAMALTEVADARRVANVGDTALDLQAGHAAGVRWNVGVLSGAHDREALEQAPHTHLIPSVAELDQVWG